MRSRLATGLLISALAAASAAGGDRPRKPTLESIGNQVMCLCGCNAPLNQCPHIDCSTKAEMKAYIQKEIAEGKDETAILQDVTLRYGVQALTAPAARGFSLAVWILPGIGLLLGLSVVVVIVRRWRRKPAVVLPATSVSAHPKVLAAVEEEMKSTGLE
jgi:cytochrome c-type biogenesis protein CcmH